MVCHKETEQAQEDKALEQVGAWEEVKAAVAKAEAVVFRQVQADTASAQTVVRECLTK